MWLKNLSSKTLKTVSNLILPSILLSSMFNTPSWAMQNNSDAHQSDHGILQPRPKAVNGGWNQKQIDNIPLFFSASTLVQKNEVKIEKPDIKATNKGSAGVQKSPGAIRTNGLCSPPKTVNPSVNKGWNKTHPALIAHLSQSSQNVPKNEFKHPFCNQKNEEKKEVYQSKDNIISVNSSYKEESENYTIIINTSSEEDFSESSEEGFIVSSEEDFIEASEDEYRKKLPKNRKFKRLKKKNQIKYEDSSSSSSSSVTSIYSSRDSEDSSTESISSSTDSEDSTADEPSIDEDYKLSRKHHKSHHKGKKKASYKGKSVARPIVTTRSSKKTAKRKNSNTPFFTTAVESDEEDNFSHSITSYTENDEAFDLVTTMGTRLKLLANVYLANLEGKS